LLAALGENVACRRVGIVGVVAREVAATSVEGPIVQGGIVERNRGCHLDVGVDTGEQPGENDVAVHFEVEYNQDESKRARR
jgi:hypothetical protein